MAIIPSDEKVFMVSNSTNTVYGGSAALKAMQQWYTMEDVTNTVRPYQVFTALLTQSGGDFLDALDATTPTQNVTKGTTYTIVNASDGDFINVGAPNNNDGTSFIATNNNIPNAWGESDAALMFNTGAPVATVLENTIGNIWFTYNGVGYYNVNSNGLFISNKTYQNPVNYNLPNDITEGYNFMVQDENICSFLVFQYVSPTDDSLRNTPIEIRVYN